ncbi:MAG: DUF3368 domain-containing protein [Gammaproteobacteria bacterium]|nr:MAG: DUF3368 domain-containing protein [Gammaproteobacteria bacterium]
MQLLISDTNIIIDLKEGELLEDFFRLPYQFSVPDILFSDELEERHANLLGLGLKVSELTEDSMIKAFGLVDKYNGPSRNDCLALMLAMQENCPLLTGDGQLKKAAENEGVLVMGTLWVVEELVKREIISILSASEAYEKMREGGSRLPWGLAEERLSHLAILDD